MSCVKIKPQTPCVLASPLYPASLTSLLFRKHHGDVHSAQREDYCQNYFCNMESCFDFSHFVFRVKYHKIMKEAERIHFLPFLVTSLLSGHLLLYLMPGNSLQRLVDEVCHLPLLVYIMLKFAHFYSCRMLHMNDYCLNLLYRVKKSHCMK